MRRSPLQADVVVRGFARAIGLTLVILASVAVVVTTPATHREVASQAIVPTATITPSPASMGFAFPADLYWDNPAAAVADFDLAAGTGIRSVRLPIFWGLVQPLNSTAYDWRTVDRLVSEASRRNLAILASIGSTPTWAAAPGSTGPYAKPADAAAFGRFVSAVATRYKGEISSYEIWNEPNGAVFFDPRPDPVAYTGLLKAGYRSVKAVDPSATVVGGALGAIIGSTLADDPVEFLREMYDAGAAGNFDALSFHPYKYDLSLGAAWTMPNSPGQQLTAMRQLMIARGDGAKKIWATEFGAPTTAVSEAAQSAVIADFAEKWAELPYAGPLFFFTVRDRATGNGVTEDNFGLIRTDRSPKDAMWKLAELSHFGVATEADYTRFQNPEANNPAWGEALSPVVPVTRSGVRGRYFERAAVYEVPKKGFIASPAAVATLLAQADIYPVSEFSGGYQDVATGGRVYYSEATGPHLVGGGVISAWTRAFGLAISDEIPQADGGVKVTFQRGFITWRYDTGAIATRS